MIIDYYLFYIHSILWSVINFSGQDEPLVSFDVYDSVDDTFASNWSQPNGRWDKFTKWQMWRIWNNQGGKSPAKVSHMSLWPWPHNFLHDNFRWRELKCTNVHFEKLLLPRPMIALDLVFKALPPQCWISLEIHWSIPQKKLSLSRNPNPYIVIPKVLWDQPFKIFPSERGTLEEWALFNSRHYII